LSKDPLKPRKNKREFISTMCFKYQLVSSPNARLFVKIMDEDMTSDDTVAEGYFNFQSCGLLSGQSGSYRLLLNYTPVNGKASTKG
jgi:hypothetical protein